MTRRALLLFCLVCLSCGRLDQGDGTAVQTDKDITAKRAIQRIETVKSVKAEAVMVPVRVNGKWGYIDAKGEIVITPQLESAGYFSEGLAPVTINGKYGFINKVGAVVIQPQFDDYGPFSEGLAWVSVGNSSNFRHGFVDTKGNQVVPLMYSSVGDFHDGLAQVESTGRWGYIDKAGQTIIKPQYEASGAFAEGLAAVSSGEQWGYIDKAGRMAIPPQFTNASRFSEGLARVRKGSQWVYVDKTGSVILTPACDSNGLGDFSEGLALINMGGVLEKGQNPKTGDRLVGSKIGFIDKEGSVVVTPQFLSAGDFHDGLAAVGPDGSDEQGFVLDKRGYINKKGELVIPARFDWAGDFREGLALVSVGDKYGYIDRIGKYIWKPTKWTLSLSRHENRRG